MARTILSARALSSAFVILCTTTALAQSIGDSIYWAQRDARLSQYTFEFELRTHEIYLARKIIPAETLHFGSTTQTLPAIDHGWEFDKKTTITIARKGDSTVATGDLSSYNVSVGKPIPLPVRLFFGPGWVGGLSEVPDNNNFSLGYFSVYRTLGESVAAHAPDNGSELDGMISSFLIGTNPFALYSLPWTAARQADGSTALQAQNYTGVDHVRNFMASNAPVDFTIRVASDGRILSGEEFIARKVPINKLPPQAITVKDWRKVGGYPVPSETVVHCIRDISGRLYGGFTDYHWKLLNAYLTSVPPRPPIPLGTHVADWRLTQTEYDPGNTPPSDKIPTYYKWAGHLPTLDELRSISVTTQHSLPAISWLSSLLAYGIPLSLIIIGLALVVKGRKAK